MESILTNIPNVETVRWAYRFMLGRDAESDAALAHWAIPADGRVILAHFVGSSEAATHRILGYPNAGSWSQAWPGPEAVRAVFHLRFNAIPSAGEIEAELKAHPDLASLRATFLASPEVRALIAPGAPSALAKPASPAKAASPAQAASPANAARIPGALQQPHRFTILDKTFQLSGAADDGYWQNLVQGAPDLGPRRLARLIRAAFPDGGAGRVLVDAGANIGMTSMAMATAAPYFAELLCFEPDARSLPLLRQNLTANDVERARVLDFALAERDGMAQLRIDPGNRGTSLLVEAYSRIRVASGVVREVPVRRLDGVLAELGIERLDLLKIDVEGCETPVMMGAAEAIARDRPFVFTEFNPWTQMVVGARNPLDVLEEWRSAFRHMVSFDREGRPVAVLDHEGLLRVLHMTIMERGCVDDLILCDRLDWLERWGE